MSSASAIDATVRLVWRLNVPEGEDVHVSRCSQTFIFASCPFRRHTEYLLTAISDSLKMENMLNVECNKNMLVAKAAMLNFTSLSTIHPFLRPGEHH